MSTLTSFFASRVKGTVRSWPAGMKDDLLQRLGLSRGSRGVADPRLHAGRNDQPYWILLPFWLAEKYHGRHYRRALGRRVLDDILWGQYCLFLFIRLQDDLFDRHTDRASLLYPSDLFLLEAERTFSRHFPKGSQFWKIYRDCIEKTLFAIVIGDNMERRPVRNRGRLLEALGGTSTICNVGPAALCGMAGRFRDFKRVTTFSTEMMKAGAIVDDIEDMEEDLRRGRFNYAASFFLRGFRMGEAWKTKALRRVRRESVHGRGPSPLFLQIHRHLDAAEAAMRPFAVPAALEYLRSFRRSVVAMELSFQRKRIMTSIGKRGR